MKSHRLFSPPTSLDQPENKMISGELDSAKYEEELTSMEIKKRLSELKTFSQIIANQKVILDMYEANPEKVTRQAIENQRLLIEDNRTVSEDINNEIRRLKMGN